MEQDKKTYCVTTLLFNQGNTKYQIKTKLLDANNGEEAKGKALDEHLNEFAEYFLHKIMCMLIDKDKIL